MDNSGQQPGKIVTQRDIAARCGVHRSTVSFVFNGDPRIPEETAARIREVAAELGYDPAMNAAARRLIGRKYGRRELNHLVALDLSENFHRYPYWMQIFQGILDVLTPAGFSTINAIGLTGNLATDDLLPVIKRGEIDGIIGQLHLLGDLRHNLKFSDLPAVSLIVDAANCCAAVPDEHAGGYLAMRHLLDYGHRTILHFYTGQYAGMLCPINRFNGVRQALAEAGLCDESALHLMRRPDGWAAPLEVSQDSSPAHLEASEVAVRQELASMLTAHPEITAIVAINDADAIRIYYHLKALGIRVPEEISLMGFDDVDALLDADRNNILTTVALPLHELGREAARLLLRQLRGETDTIEAVCLPPTLKVRKTTAFLRR